MPPARHLLVPLLLLAAAGRAGAEPPPDSAATAEAGTASRHRSEAAAARLAFEVRPGRLSRARRLEMLGTLRAEVAGKPALAEPLAYLIADLGIPQPPLARPIEFAGFTVVSAETIVLEGSMRAFRFRGFAGDRLLEVDMSADRSSTGYPAVRVRRWKPFGDHREATRSHSRALAPGEIEALAPVLARRARSAGVRLDPSGLAAGIIQRRRESRAADH